jgi:hypothetical protein
MGQRVSTNLIIWEWGFLFLYLLHRKYRVVTAYHTIVTTADPSNENIGAELLHTVIDYSVHTMPLRGLVGASSAETCPLAAITSSSSVLIVIQAINEDTGGRGLQIIAVNTTGQLVLITCKIYSVLCTWIIAYSSTEL